MSGKKNKKVFTKKHTDLINLVIMIIGVMLVGVGIFISATNYIPVTTSSLPPDQLSQIYDRSAVLSQISSVLINVGSALIATSVITWITRKYAFELDRKKEIIDEWGIKDIYESKALMNIDSNELLKTCKKNIDVLAIGMKNFIEAQGAVLEELLKKGVKIRILTCNPDSEGLRLRTKDENLDDRTLIHDLDSLKKWVKKVNDSNPNNKIEIKFHSTYPAFGYLRIDDICFFGPNLYLRSSQSSMAIAYDSYGRGFDIFSEEFDKWWNNEDFCSEKDK